MNILLCLLNIFHLQRRVKLNIHMLQLIGKVHDLGDLCIGKQVKGLVATAMAAFVSLGKRCLNLPFLLIDLLRLKVPPGGWPPSHLLVKVL